jgi:hypothetical protein
MSLEALSNMDSMIDKGVEVDRDLSYNAHIVSIVGKATRLSPISWLCNTQLKLHAQTFITYYVHSYEYN